MGIIEIAGWVWAQMVRAIRGMVRQVAENPKRVIHALKVGAALALTSVTVLQEDLFKILGVNAIWAVMTVVVVFELTAGATVCKGSNRAFGTLLAGTLALGVEWLADLAGPNGEAYIMGVFVFLIGTLATYARFCEPFKGHYDYGVMIFLLTFILIIVSSYRVQNNLELAVSRLLNIVLGSVICLVMTMLIKPMWASDELHNIITANFDNLAQALEGFMKAYFKEEMHVPLVVREDDPIYECYKDILASKSNEESLAKYASWEPRWQSIQSSKGVWKQYVQVGGMLRNCTYTVASLHGCLISFVQGPHTSQNFLSNACQNVTMECISMLRELGKKLEQREKSSSKEDLMKALLARVENLKQVIDGLDEMPFSSSYLIKSSSPSIIAGEEVDIDQLSPTKKKLYIRNLAFATVAFLLIKLSFQIMHLVDAQKGLEILARFREPKTSFEKGTNSKKSNPCLDTLSIQTIE